MKPDYANSLYVEPYLSLFSGINKLNRDEGNFIEYNDYSQGYCLYVYDLMPDICEGQNFNLIKQGTVHLALTFSVALEVSISVICYFELENVIEIDRSRNVIFDFGS